MARLIDSVDTFFHRTLLMVLNWTGMVALAWVATRLLRGLLFETEPLDPATLVGAAALLVGAAVRATDLPSWRGEGRSGRRAARGVTATTWEACAKHFATIVVAS